MVNLVPTIILVAIWIGSFAIAGTPVLSLDHASLLVRLLSFSALPILFLFSFVLISGSISLLGKSGIVSGKFPRELNNPIYKKRRIYTTCWTTVFYFKPLYATVLAIPALKKMTFGIFGYRGSSKFTVYPDTWIRDLPLLKIQDGTYLSNRATIGTNLCLTDGNIFVDQVSFGKDSMLGHLAMVGPGTKVGDKSEIGVGAALGIRVNVHENVRVGICSMINHGVILRKNSTVGNHSFLGLRVELGEDVNLPAGANIPAGAVIATQDDVNNYITSDTKIVDRHKERLMELFNEDHSSTA